MSRSLLSIGMLSLLVPSALAQPPEGNLISLPAPGGWVMLDDGVMLVVSQPKTGELVYIDTVREQEGKRVSVDFKPAAMALQKGTIYAGAEGASVVYALDAKTGKQKQEIVLGGDAVSHLACHPDKGPVFASTATHAVYLIDPASGSATKTTATGDFLVVDPVEGSALFTGVQPPLGDGDIYVEDLPGGRIRIFWDRWGARAFILKYAIQGKTLKLVSSQKNAAVNAYTLAISPDGKKVMMTSGGGWRPPVEGGTGGGYMSAAFSTANLEVRMGEAPSASNIAFHPVLNLGVVNRQGVEMIYFNPKSMVAQAPISLAKGADGRGLLVTFGAKGTKVVLWNGDNPQSPHEGLHFYPLELTTADRAVLEKAYGKLPALPKPVASKTPSTTPKTPMTRPEPKPTSTASKPTPSRVTPKSSPTSRPTGATGRAVTIPKEKGVIASSGFNNSSGINKSRLAKSSYSLGKSNVPGGQHEPGWQAAWPADERATFVTEDVGEGDGALHLTATTNYGRLWSEPQRSTFKIETMVRCPMNGGVGCYVWGTELNTTGPMWCIKEGEFRAYAGTGKGDGKWVTIAPCKTDTWHKVTLMIDVGQKNYRIKVDDTESDQELGYRFNPAQLQGINFLVEEQQQIYLDAIRILESDE